MHIDGRRSLDRHRDRLWPGWQGTIGRGLPLPALPTLRSPPSSQPRLWHAIPSRDEQAHLGQGGRVGQAGGYAGRLQRAVGQAHRGDHQQRAHRRHAAHDPLLSGAPLPIGGAAVPSRAPQRAAPAAAAGDVPARLRGRGGVGGVCAPGTGHGVPAGECTLSHRRGGQTQGHLGRHRQSVHGGGQRLPEAADATGRRVRQRRFRDGASPARQCGGCAVAGSRGRFPDEQGAAVLRQGTGGPGAPLSGHPGRRQSGRQDPAHREPAGQGECDDPRWRHGVHIPQSAGRHVYR
eukprot:ctg_544.g315